MEKLRLNGVIPQHMGMGDPGIAPCLSIQSAVLLQHLFEGLASVSDAFALGLLHVDLLKPTNRRSMFGPDECPRICFVRQVIPAHHSSHIMVHSSIRMRLPGGTNRVVAGASITAMPSTTFPGRIPSIS